MLDERETAKMDITYLMLPSSTVDSVLSRAHLRGLRFYSNLRQMESVTLQGLGNGFHGDNLLYHQQDKKSMDWYGMGAWSVHRQFHYKMVGRAAGTRQLILRIDVATHSHYITLHFDFPLHRLSLKSTSSITQICISMSAGASPTPIFGVCHWAWHFCQGELCALDTKASWKCLDFGFVVPDQKLQLVGIWSGYRPLRSQFESLCNGRGRGSWRSSAATWTNALFVSIYGPWVDGSSVVGRFIQPKHAQTTQDAVMCILRQAGISHLPLKNHHPHSGTTHQNSACHPVREDLGRHILSNTRGIVGGHRL